MPGTQGSLRPIFRVGKDETWAAQWSMSPPYTYINCFDEAGGQGQHKKMKAPYWYEHFTTADDHSQMGNSIWAVVHYDAGGSTAPNPSHAWLQHLNSDCGHVAWYAVPLSVGTSRGKNTGMAIDDQGRIFASFRLTNGGSHLHYIHRFDPWASGGGVWSTPTLFTTAGLPGDPGPDPRLRWDADLNELSFGTGWIYSIDPDTLATVGAKELQVPNGVSVRDWDVYAQHVVANLYVPGGASPGLTVFDPNGALNTSDDDVPVGWSGLDLGTADTSASPAFMPTYTFALGPLGGSGRQVQETQIKLVGF